MKKSTSKSYAISKLYCSVFGHNYKVSKNITKHIKEYKCPRCNKELTVNANGKLTELTPKYKEINSALESIYTKRMLKIKQQKATLSPSAVSYAS